MIHAILINPTIDILYKISNFYVGGTFKVEEKLELPVGKAISFAIAAREINSELDLNIIAFIGQEEITRYSRFLNKKDINYEFIEIKGNTRSNKTIIDPIKRITTHIREKGFKVTLTNIQQLKSIIKKRVEKDDFCVFGGSIPLGSNDDIYYELIKIIKKRQAISILDSSGIPLIKGCKAEPRIIKPNLKELSQILNKKEIQSLTFKDPIKDSSELIQQANKLLSVDLSLILITLGEKGSIILSNEYAYFGRVDLNEKIIDTVGAGDSFLAGFMVEYSQGKDILTCFRNAIAAGAASCLEMGPGILNRKTKTRLLKKIMIKEIT
ncbi:MAG: hypothetical protein EU547_02730 [Promethearchaeota archaeon]|nr:MAG: hypothetical protein EU547_02730 [Candidatus Lokiarchaeota archaeon]